MQKTVQPVAGILWQRFTFCYGNICVHTWFHKTGCNILVTRNLIFLPSPNNTSPQGALMSVELVQAPASDQAPSSWGDHWLSYVYVSSPGRNISFVNIQGRPINRDHFVLRPITLEILNRYLLNLAKKSKSLHFEHSARIYLNQRWKIVASSSEWQWHFYKYKFWIVIIFLHHFSQPICTVISLFYYVRNKEWPHLLISCSQEKHQRQKSDNANANIPASAAVLRCPSLCRAWGMQKSFAFNEAES